MPTLLSNSLVGVVPRSAYARQRTTSRRIRQSTSNASNVNASKGRSVPPNSPAPRLSCQLAPRCQPSLPRTGGPGRARRAPPALRAIDGGDNNEELYEGSYSTFWTDPEQLKGLVIFCAFLGSFFAFGLLANGIVLPMVFGAGDMRNVLTFDYWFRF